MFRKITVYDADAEEERQKQALLRHINRMREQRPGLRPTAGQAFVFFVKLLLIIGIVWGVIVGAFAL